MQNLSQGRAQRENLQEVMNPQKPETRYPKPDTRKLRPEPPKVDEFVPHAECVNLSIVHDSLAGASKELYRT